MSASPQTSPSFVANLQGGLLAGLVALPVDISYGLMAVAPLGSHYAQLGILGVGYAAVVGGLVAILAGMRPGQLFGARSSLALVVAALISHLAAQSAYHHGDGSLRVELILAMVAACIALAGVVQWGFAVLRLGRAIKFMPLPVLSGFNLGVATMMALVALRPAAGLPNGWHWAGWSGFLAELQLLPLLVCAVTLVACFASRRWLRRLPPLLSGLLVGLALHHGLAFFVAPEHLGSGFAAASLGWPDLSRLTPLVEPGFALGAQLASLLPFVAAMATLAAVETLLCAASIDNLTQSSHDSRRELAALGCANLASALAGGLPGSGSMGRSSVLLGAGAQARWAGLGYVAVIALILGLAAHWLAWLPRAVAAALLLFLAWGLVDEWTRQSLRRLLPGSGLEPAQRRALRNNLGITALVALTAVLGDLVQAVFVGVAAAILLFVRHHSRSIVRRTGSGRERHSLKVRPPSHMKLLQAHGGAIAIIEAEGMLFFGTAEQLAATADRCAGEADWVLLDLRRVSDCDTTGALILRRLQTRLASRGKTLLLSGVGQPGQPRQGFSLSDLGPLLSAGCSHNDLDQALEAAENALLVRLAPPADAAAPLPLGQTTLGEGLGAEEEAILVEALVQRHVPAGGVIFRQGDTGRSLFVSLRGSVGIRLPLPNGGALRVASFAPGVVFGEMAVLEGQPRSADAIAEDDVLLLELSGERLRQLESRHPRLAGQLMRNLCCSLSRRLRNTTGDLRNAYET